MKNYTRILTILFLALLTFVMSATAQTNDNKNKAIVETTDGTQQLNTDDISIIRFDGDKVTFVQPWGESVFDRTLRSLSFLRPLPGTLRLTVNAGINENSSNRAQEIDGDGKLKTTWESGDVVYVYADESSTTPLGTLTPAPADYGSSSATLVGDITGTDLADGTPTLYFSTQPRATYSLATQNGTVGSLFYCTATASVTINGGNATISGTLDFNRPISVVKFTLKDKNKATDDEINADKLVVTVDGNSYTVTPTVADDELFVGIPSFSDKTVYLTANEGSTVYTYEKASVSFAENKYYTINVKMSEYNALSAPLTFQAMADGVTVKLHKFQTAQPSLQYRKNDGDWTNLAFDGNNSTSISLNTGDKLSFKGDNTTLTQDQNGYCKFELSGNCYVYGNIMSLLDKDNFPTNKTLSAGFTFYQLFLGAPIYNHPSKTLVLPATTLTASCYADMFAGCTHLTTAPALPAATLANACYKNMFRGCTGLTTAPTLSATTLANECYRNMFGGCTALTTAPALQAESLANECYEEMFSGCTGLTTAPNLPAKTAAEYCYYYMFEGCTALATAPVLSATTMASHCYYAMFKGCTSLTTAPVLPATTLASYCYANMFLNCTGLTTAPTILPATTLVANCYRSMFDGCKELTTAPVLPAATLQYYCYAWMFDGCTKLNNVTCLATNISADDCTYYWLNGVAATGTFTKAESMTEWTTGSSGIPSGWTSKTNVVDLSSLTADYVANDYDILTGTLAGNYKISIADGATVTLDGATINGVHNDSYRWAGITCLGNATIILEGTNTVKGFHSIYPGIQAAHNNTGVGDEYTLTIQGTGSLTASSNGYACGIGGGLNIAAGNIVINGGNINATGGDQAAGIGSGDISSCGTITINGGTISAIGGSSAAGIGSGSEATCGNILISGGDVTATSALQGAGIGSGCDGASCGTITISGGKVTAQGGEHGAGIGSGSKYGSEATCGNILIEGGTVTATGGDSAAGIGSGHYSNCGTITITTGVTSVTATKGSYAPNSIGTGDDGTCGTVTIGGTVYWDGSAYQNDGATYLATSPLVYPTPVPSAPSGAINGLFSVSSTKQVYFSQGNLKATTTDSWVTWTFSFMEHQYSTVETASQDVGSYYESQNTVSLFGWGTSGISDYTPRAGQYWPNTTGNDNSGYYAYDDATKNLYDESGKADWGYNAISNGGNTVNSGWRTLTTEEWQYLFEHHTYGAHTVHSQNGIIVLPDGVSSATGFVSGLDNWTVVTDENWDAMEAAGAVFLPAAGYRSMSVVYEFGNNLYYWSSTCKPEQEWGMYNAYCVFFYKSDPYFSAETSWSRCQGFSVRLVKDAN